MHATEVTEIYGRIAKIIDNLGLINCHLMAVFTKITKRSNYSEHRDGRAGERRRGDEAGGYQVNILKMISSRCVTVVETLEESVPIKEIGRREENGTTGMQ